MMVQFREFLSDFGPLLVIMGMSIFCATPFPKGLLSFLEVSTDASLLATPAWAEARGGGRTGGAFLPSSIFEGWRSVVPRLPRGNILGNCVPLRSECVGSVCWNVTVEASREGGFAFGWLERRSRGLVPRSKSETVFVDRGCCCWKGVVTEGRCVWLWGLADRARCRGCDTIGSLGSIWRWARPLLRRANVLGALQQEEDVSLHSRGGSSVGLSRALLLCLVLATYIIAEGGGGNCALVFL